MAFNLPGNYKINQLSIVSNYGRQIVDLTAIYQQLNIFESIFTSCITGYVTVTDTYNLISGKNYSLPIMGNELIFIEAEVPDYFVQDSKGNWVQGDPNVVTYYGRVTDIKNISLINEGAKNYEIHFCSEELILDRSYKISKSYKNSRNSDIVEKIFNEFFPKTTSSYEFEKTKNLSTVVVPNWNPIKAINWLASRSLSAAYQTPSFFFYQTLYNDGYVSDPQNCVGKVNPQSSTKFWFLSLDEIIADWGNDVRKTIFYVPANNGAAISPTNPETYMKFSNAMNYEVLHSFDTLENTTTGMFASKLFHHDVVNKKINPYDYTYDSTYSSFKHLDNSKLFTGVLNSRDKTFSDNDYTPTHIMVASTGTPENPNYLNDISYGRINRIQSLDTYRLRILIPGDGLTQSGDLIEFKLPSLEVGGNGRVYDQFYNGKYLVTSIRHMFTRREYKMTLDCSKESLNQDVRTFNPNA